MATKLLVRPPLLVLGTPSAAKLAGFHVKPTDRTLNLVAGLV